MKEKLMLGLSVAVLGLSLAEPVYADCSTSCCWGIVSCSAYSGSSCYSWESCQCTCDCLIGCNCSCVS